MESELSRWRALTPIMMRWVLKIFLWAAFATWIAVFFLYPSSSLEPFFVHLFKVAGGTMYKLLGAVFLVFNAPIVLVTLLAIIYVTAFPREHHRTNKKEVPRIRLWTFPVVTTGPYIVSAAELIGMLVFFIYVVWSFSAYTVQNYRLTSKMQLSSSEKRYLMLENTGLRLASIGFTFLSFLFLPITRGSVLLRLIDIPIEHAARYHVWLGSVMMMIFTLHGLCYLMSWILQGRLLNEIVKWECDNFAYLSGLITLFCGLLISVTSIPKVRRKYFEVFYYFHQLYAVFIIFLVMHIGDSAFSVAAWGIILFLIDRYLRFCQSRQTVDIISANILPCGTTELVISKPTNMKYGTLSFIFLRVKELSLLQWHPFSVSSSPLDGNHHISVLVKSLGGWTKNLKDNIASEQASSKITASVEGPYGHESEYYLMYENLILVAGGIGISPFLAILRHIVHLIKANKPCSPKNVTVIWSVKTSKELSLLSLLDLNSICPSFSTTLKLDIQTYITRESAPKSEGGNSPYKGSSSSSFSISNRNTMSPLTGSGNNIWSGLYVILSTVGIFIFTGLMEAFYVTPYHVTCWWLKGLLLLVCIIAGVVIFGGLLVFFWHIRERRVLNHKENISHTGNEVNSQKIASQLESQSSYTSAHYGHRPDFQSIFDSAAERWGHVNVGVLVCGPPSLQTGVARECRSRTLKRRKNQPVFHFHCHSFEF